MRKLLILLLSILAATFLAQSNTYTLSQLAELVPALEDGTGVAVVDGAYVINLPASLPDGVSGLGYDNYNIVLTKTNFTINGDLIISEGETLLFGGSASMEINGNLTITGATIGAAEGAENKAKGFRMHQEGVSATITNSEFNYVGINYGNGTEEGSLTVTGCTFNDHNAKGGNSVIYFTSLSKGNLIENNTFTNPTLSAVASGANVACGVTIRGNVINKPNASTRLYPGINMSATGSYDIVIDGNEIHGPAVITSSGGIALFCLLGTPPTGTYYVTNNFIENCSYGITFTGPGYVRMINNTILNNKYIANPNQGGSGLNITCNSANVIAKAYMQGNHIEGNLWGCTVIGNVDINAGCINPTSPDEYNCGGNVFIDNGNGDPYVKYDWYNNTANTSWAQGNIWNVEIQDADHIAEVVVDQSDNASLGQVIYIPAEFFMVDGLCYNKNSDGISVNVSGLYLNLSGDVIIPSSITYSGKKYLVTSIGSSAFSGCTGLTSVTIPNSVTSIGSSAFSGCTGLTSVTMGNSVTLIGSSTFYNCSGLTSVTIPNSVTSIGTNAFYGCSGLTSVTIPNSVTSIGDCAFGYCSGLTSMVVNSGNTKYDSRNNCNAIIETVTNILIFGCKNTIIPNSVTEIGERAFYNCSGLTSVTIGNSVTSIGRYAFDGCSSLTSVTIPNSVTSIGESAFRGCSGLTSVTIGNSVTSIPYECFYYCSVLTSVIIPNSVTSIGNYAFSGCSGLNELYCYALEPPTLGSNCFQGVNSEIPVYVPYISAYIDNNNWNRYFTNFLPLGNNQKLTVNLPSAASGGKYKDMYIYAKNATTGSNTRCLVTDKMTYNLYVPSNTSYDITLENSIGTHFGEIKDVQVNDEDVEVSFQSLLTPQTVAVAVTLPGGIDVTDKVNITWTAADSSFLAQGAILNCMVENTTVNCDIKLPQELAAQYQCPKRFSHKLSSTSSNSILKELQPFGEMICTGKVTDVSSDRPIYRATVTVSQLLNGTQNKSFTSLTDADGNFELTALSADGIATVSAQGYVTQNFNVDGSSASISIGEVKLNPITGVVVDMSLTYQKSVKQGEEQPDAVEEYDDYRNISFTVFNKTKNKDVEISVQYPSIVLLDDVVDGDNLTIAAHSLNNAFADNQVNCTVNGNSANAAINLIQLGGIQATYSQAQSAQVMGLLYDSSGSQVMVGDYVNNTLSLSNIPDGNYQLVTMEKNERVASATSLSVFDEIGLAVNTDYLKDAVQVSSGTISVMEVGNVPALDDSELYFTGTATSVNTNKPSVTIGNYAVLTANIDFKKAFAGKIANVQLDFELPQGCEFVDNSVLTDGNLSPYLLDGNHISVNVPDNGGQVKFCVMPTLAGNVKIGTVAHFVCEGRNETQPIGAAAFTANALAISVPSTTNSAEIAISGSAPTNSAIRVYDGDKLIGTTTAGAGGSWNLSATLTDTFNVSVHEIQAHATTPQGKELLSQNEVCLYDNSYIVPQSITLVYRNYTSVFYPMEKRTEGQYYSYVPGSPLFTLIAQFDTNNTDKLANVIFNVLTSDGKIKAFPAVYDAAIGKWAASAEFPSSYSLPVNVNVSYDVINNDPDYLSPNLQSDIENVNHLVSEAMSVISDKFTPENCTYDDENISYELISEELGQNWPCNIHLLNYDEIAVQIVGDDKFIEVENEGKLIWVKIWDDDCAIHSIFVNKEDEIAISYDIIHSASNNVVSSNVNQKYFTAIVFALPILRDLIYGSAMARQTWKVINFKIESIKESLSAVKAMAEWRCPDGSYLFDDAVRTSIYKFVEDAEKILNDIDEDAETQMRNLYNLIAQDMALDGIINTAMLGLPMGTATSGAITSDAGKALTQFGVGELLGQSLNHLYSHSYSEVCKELLRRIMGQFVELDNECSQFIMSLRNKKRNCDNEEEPIDDDFQTPPIRPSIDPSGFVYEAVPSNRLQGVTATIYYKETVEDMWGEQHEQEVMWDAEEYAQKNPLFTDENGMYQWDVPQGMWQVRFNKNGYEPTRSEWLPVPPPQLDVNIGMTQLRQPEVAMVHAYKYGVVLTFDKYMRPETLTTDNISVTQNGENVTGTIELMNEEQGDNEKFASKLRFVPLSEFTAKTVTLNVKNNVESYAGIRMNSDFTQTFDIEKQIYVIGIDTLINVGYGESREVLVEALPVDVAKGKTLNVRSVQPLIAEVDNENYTLDKHGRATITVSGNLPGATSIILNVEGFDLKKNATVQVVDQSSLVTEKPIASVANGLVFDEGFTVELTCSTPGAVIYYTTNGACPCDEEERILYNGSITINTNTTLKAIAIAPGYYESDIATYYYFESSAIDEVSYVAPFKVSPTMVRDGFVVKGNFYECDVKLYSLSGSLVLHRENVGCGEFVSLSNVNSGVYIAVITVNGRPWPVKIVKM